MRILLILILAATIVSCSRSQQRNTPYVVNEQFVHKYGIPVEENEWASRGKHGQIVSTLRDGVVVTKNYSYGVIDGDTTYTFPHNPVIEKIETYSQGNRIKEKTFYLSGSPKTQIEFLPNGMQVITNWYDHGTPRSHETMVNGILASGEYYDLQHHLENQVQNDNGIRVIRDTYGQILFKDTIQNGLMTARTGFHPNETPSEVTSYQNNVPWGIRKTFLPSGEPNTIEEWANGYQQGVTIQFKNGEKVAEITYAQGKKNGIERHFRDGTTVVEEITWKNNTLNGPTTNYLGPKPVTEWFFMGRKVSQSDFELRSNKPLRPQGV